MQKIVIITALLITAAVVGGIPNVPGHPLPPARASVAPAKSRPATVPVAIENFSFSPPALVVPAGTAVLWTNRDDSPHTVVEQNGRFKSTALDTDDTYQHTFDHPGAYEYYCSLHPRMTGKVIVEPK